MRSLLRAAVGSAALGALAWTVFPGMTALALPPVLMLARCVVIGVAFCIGWVSLGLAPDRPANRRDLAAAGAVAGLILVGTTGIFSYNRYQERQREIVRSAQAREIQAAFEECKKRVESNPNPKMDTELDIWMNCNSK